MGGRRVQRAVFETRSLPTRTRSYPRRFTFYVALPDRSIVAATDRKLRLYHYLSQAGGWRPHHDSAGWIEIFPGAGVTGVTIPSLRRCCME